MVKNSNCRITITISNKQKKWLDGMCEKLHLTTSKLIAWLLWTKTKDVQQTKTLIEQPKKAIAIQEYEVINEEDDIEEIILNRKIYPTEKHRRDQEEFEKAMARISRM